MKLYYAPGACSLAPHIAARESGLALETERVDLATRKTSSGADFKRINPKGYVPAFETRTGEILTEVAVILQYIADRAPQKDLAPAAGTFERYRLQEWLNFIATEVHKGFGPLWNPKSPAETREMAIAQLGRRFDFLSAELENRKFLMGSQFTVADAYLFTILGWARYHKIDMGKWPSLAAYSERVMSRPAVREAMKAEGLI